MSRHEAYDRQAARQARRIARTEDERFEAQQARRERKRRGKAAVNATAGLSTEALEALGTGGLAALVRRLAGDVEALLAVYAPLYFPKTPKDAFSCIVMDARETLATLPASLRGPAAERKEGE